MTTHDKDKIIAATIGCIEGPYDRSRAITIVGNEIERLYAIAFEAGSQSVDTPVALAEAYRCGEEAGRQAEREELSTIFEKMHYWLTNIAVITVIRARGEVK